MAIAKLYTVVDSLNTTKSFVVKGFQSGKATFKITGDDVSMSIWVHEKTTTAPQTQRAKVYKDGVLQSVDLLLEEGTHELYFDLEQVGNILFYFAGEVEGVFSTAYEKLPKSLMHDDSTPLMSSNIIKNSFKTNSFTKDTNSFKSAIITVNVKSGYSNFTIKGSKTSEKANGDSSDIPYYINNDKKSGQIRLDEGIHIIHVDLMQIKSIYTAVVKYGDTDPTLIQFLDIPVPENVKTVDYGNSIVRYGGWEEIIPFSLDDKQIEITARPLKDGTGNYRFSASKDNGLTWENITMIQPNEVVEVEREYALIENTEKTFFTNIEGFTHLKFKIDGLKNSNSIAFTHEVFNTYVDRKIVEKKRSVMESTRVLKGYKYMTLDLSNYINVIDTSARINFRLYKGGSPDVPTPYKAYNINMERIGGTWSSGFTAEYNLGELYGTVKDYKVVIEVEDLSFDTLVMAVTPHTSLTGGEVTYTDTPATLTLSNTRPKAAKNELLKQVNDYNIYQLPKMDSLFKKDVFNKDVIEYSSTEIRFYMGGYFGFRYDIDFNNENVPSLKDGETIKFAYLLPFNSSTRGAIGTIKGAGSRICVFTNKGRVFHNFPKRKSGSLPNSDLFIFSESSIYNRYNKWLPVNDKSKVTAKHKYLPIFKDYDYNQFNGRVSGTDGFVDHLNDGGIGQESGYLLHDIKMTDLDSLGRLTYCNMAKGDKMSVFGNYMGGRGTEPLVIGTNDGGMTWYMQSWFAAVDDYSANVKGSSIDFSSITDVAGAYVPNSLKVGRKNFNIPTNEIKDPETPFIINEEDSSLITAMSVSNGTVLITTAEDVDYIGASPIVYIENISANAEWDYICNNGFTADNSVNNGVFFRATKVAKNKYELYADVGNPYEGDKLCWHIHGVNRTQSGYLISTGESYTEGRFEGGFLYMLEQTYGNGYNTLSVAALRNTIRLTSSMDGVNRACGAYLFNDSSDPTLLFVSDDTFAYSNKRNIKIAGRDIELPIAPLGIYKGKLSDIDDLSKFECICEHPLTIVSLLEHMGNFASDGHAGSLMISKGGKIWNIENNESGNNINGADQYGNIYFGDKMIEFK